MNTAETNIYSEEGCLETQREYVALETSIHRKYTVSKETNVGGFMMEHCLAYIGFHIRDQPVVCALSRQLVSLTVLMNLSITYNKHILRLLVRQETVMNRVICELVNKNKLRKPQNIKQTRLIHHYQIIQELFRSPLA